MSHTQRSWLDRITFPPPHSAPSPVRPPNRSVSYIPQHGVPCGRLAEQSQVKGYEPTVLSRLAARSSYPREEQALVRLTTLARTSLRPLLRRKWMKDPIWDCLPHLCQHRREKCSAIHGFITLTQKIRSHFHHQFLPQR